VLVTDKRYEYSNVKEWGKNAPGGNALLLDKVIVPCKLGNEHWTCICAFIKEKKIQYYDSFGGQGNRYLDALLQYLQDEAKQHSTPFDRDEWNLVQNDMHNTPQQQNVLGFATILKLSDGLYFNHRLLYY